MKCRGWSLWNSRILLKQYLKICLKHLKGSVISIVLDEIWQYDRIIIYYVIYKRFNITSCSLHIICYLASDDYHNQKMYCSWWNRTVSHKHYHLLCYLKKTLLCIINHPAVQVCHGLQSSFCCNTLTMFRFHSNPVLHSHPWSLIGIKSTCKDMCLLVK